MSGEQGEYFYLHLGTLIPFSKSSSSVNSPVKQNLGDQVNKPIFLMCSSWVSTPAGPASNPALKQVKGD